MSDSRNRTAFAWEKATVTNAIKRGTAATYAGTGSRMATAALVTVEDQSIRLRYDGGSPSATDGHLLTAGSSILIEGASNIRNLSMFRAGGTDGNVQITYLR